jgi:glucose/arabinose dehydrogenase
VVTDTSRRRFLATAVATSGTLTGINGSTVAHAQSTPETIRPSQTVRLGGELTGWVGRAPAAIRGRTNPTLALEPGRTYRITWENTDGRRHNVALLDSEGAVRKRTPFVTERGAVQTFTFTATREMVEYVCEAHPTSMRGDIRIKGRQTNTSNRRQSESQFMPWGPTVGVETIADGPLSAPLGFEIPPDATERRFIVDQVGQICVHGPNGLEAEPFLDIADRLVNFGRVEAGTIDERGLLGLAFHPGFHENGRFYVRYSAPARPKTPAGYTHIERLSEFTAGQNRRQGRPRSERIVLEIPSPHYTHNAGSVVFGPDGFLYMGMGDGGGSKLEAGHADDWYRNNGGNGQNVGDNLLGSILRIDVDSRERGKPYGIPDANPLVGRAGLDEHYAWGFRNPWRMSFNGGRLFVADVGESNYEEVNIVEKGGNYGWNVREGRHCYSTDSPQHPPEQCPRRTPPDVRGGERLIDPIIEYPHVYEGNGVGLAVIGGYVYENDTLPGLQGTYVFGDYSQNGKPRGSLFAASPPTRDGRGGRTGWSLEELRVAGSKNGELGSYVLGFGRDAAGELYVLTTDVLGVDPTTTTGRVRKLVPKTPPTPTATRTRNRAASRTEGPGFGVLAALGGLSAGLARVLAGDS